MVIFGASGDLTKRLLVPALYNLACDGLLSENFAVIGSGRSDYSDETFREVIAGDDGLRAFHTRKEFDEAECEKLIRRFHFHTGNIDVDDFRKLRARVAELDAEFGAKGNVLFYFAMAPKFFGPLCDTLYEAGFQDGPGGSSSRSRSAPTSSRRER
jgi:glucose-6-phosphate 1-dehydrogenase